ncbi:MAG: hypothetical protein NUV85_04185 [Candidatus Berkelbacteria bacterium]|nr:hypothetical protein [Candidatus Berkelbacteria bacterium]
MTCTLVEFLGELEAVGYELVDAFCQERINPRDSRQEVYYMVRFQFAKQGFISPSDNFSKRANTIRAELQRVCETTLWRVRAYLNPFKSNSEEIPGQNAVSINLEVRQPLFRPDGQPVTARAKDERGKPIGDPLPLQPTHYLRVENQTIKLVPA